MLLAIQEALDARQANIWTSLPAMVQSFNPTKGTVEAQPTIQVQLRQPDGTWIDTTLPLCVDCPVGFMGGGGFVQTFPIAAKDEGVLVFSSRCLDLWWQNGGIQKQAELRMHDLSDGFFWPTGGMSLPNVATNISTTGAQWRSKDGNTVVELAAGNIVNVTAPGGVNFTGPVTFNGTVEFLSTVGGAAGGGGTVNFGAANIKTTGDVQTGSVASVNAHLHTEVTHGSANSGPPAG